MADKTPEEIAKDFKRLQSLATALGKDLSKLNIRPVAEDAAVVGELLGKWSDELANSTAAVEDLSAGFKSVVQQFTKGNIGLSETKKTFNGLSSIANKIAYDYQNINKLTQKELKDQKKKALQAQQDAKTSKNLLELQKRDLIAANKSEDLSFAQKKKNREEIAKINEALEENQSIIDGTNASYNDLLDQIDTRIAQEGRINELMGLGGAAIEAVGGSLDKLGMGSLKDALGLDEVAEKMEETASRIDKINEKRKEAGKEELGGGKMKVLSSGIKEAGSQIKSNLTDPLVVVGFLTTQLIDAFISVDKQAGDLAKNFGISYDAALGLKSELTSAANQSYLLNINSQGLVEAFTSLNNLFGTFGQISEDVLEDFSRLTGEANLSGEAVSALYKTTLLTGKGLEDSTKEFAGQAQALAMQNGLALNQKQILEAVQNISSATLLQLQGQPEALAEAVVNAKALGVTLEQVENISKSLLNFESSISSELEAELLTGKQLNLERARLAALNGKVGVVAEEIAKQVGSAAQFTEMNVIQQEALAKSVGMTRDSLADALMEREALAKLSGVEGKNAQERFNNLVKEVGLEEAKKQLGDEQLANLYGQQNVQERFTAAIEKLKDIFIAIAEPVLQFVSPLVDIVETVLPAINLLLSPFTGALKLAAEYAREILFIFTAYKGIQLGINIAKGYETAMLARQMVLEEGKFSLKNLQLVLENESLAVKTLAYAMSLKDIAAEKMNIALSKVSALFEKKEAGFSIANAAMKVISSLSKIPVVGAALGIAAAGAVTALGYKLLKADDMVSPGYGKRTILSPEGAIQLNDKDTVIAGTNLGGGGNSNNTQQQPQTSINITPLVDRLERLISIVETGGIVNLDGTKVGTVLSMVPVKA